MPNYRRANTKGATYFFTVVAYRRRRFLCEDIARKALRKSLLDMRTNHQFTIDGWVLLPDHMHCIWTLPPDDANFSVCWAIIKRSVTKQCGPSLHRKDWMNASKSKRKESTIWQRRFWEPLICDDKDYEHT